MGGAPAGVQDGGAGQSKGGGLLGRVKQVQRAGGRKQYRVLRKYREPLLTEHKGTRWWGIKREHVEGHTGEFGPGTNSHCG